MASVLGTSRGSGGLSSQLKCKSKRRRRRRPKRKGKDLAFCAASANCTLGRVTRVWGAACFRRSTLGCRWGVGTEESVLEFRSLCKGLGAPASAEGTGTRPERRAQQSLGWERRGHRSRRRRTVPSPTRAPQPGAASDPLGGDTSTRCQRKHPLKPAAPETGTRPGARSSILMVLEEGMGRVPAITFPNWPTVPT